MAFEISLDFNGEAGIPVESFSFGAANTATIGGGGGGGGAGKVVFTNLTITKLLDQYSPLLYKAVGRGTHIESVTLLLSAAQSSAPASTASYKLTNVIVTSVRDTGSRHGGPFPEEEVAFDFRSIEINIDGNIFSYDRFKGV